MALVILALESPAVQPRVGGLPESCEDFDITVEVMLAFAGHEADDVTFSFSVLSPSAMSRRQAGAFVSNVLLLQTFSWEHVRRHIERLLMQVHSCTDWPSVIMRISPFMRPMGLNL